MTTSPEFEHPIKAYGYAARDTSGILSPLTFSRRATGEKDVRFRVLYCGICHSDLHFVKKTKTIGGLPATQQPQGTIFLVQHEIVGVVTEVGSKVEKFKIGDKVGVGCLVGSCRSCQSCASDYEQDCLKQVFTYGVPNFDGTQTYGGYSVGQRICHLIPPGTKVGVVGLGGLGHVAVKMAKAFGAEVTVFSTTSAKEQDAIDGLKADHFINSKDQHQLEAARGTLDGIIDTVSGDHPIAPLLNALTPHGKLVLVGAPESPLEVAAFSLIMGRKTIAGSNIGGIKETQEMLDFAAEHGITADIEIIPIDYVNTAMERLVKSDVRYRFVIDVGNSIKAE
ncbi:putative GroES-like superfamily, alcohol dehydrogenase, polyketide synthase, enoylreductase [Helianthus annuus]|nr:putative GroES-like superfamily, alcohol dehydrogenase, polyketide synthase, enoylreductase [Helianthus annuus]KAJ0485925.1 putative GroES-like superfamily, alcohol dehydrogenase, polyketide synthase, enoylreductase [Helianthus annuus]KAJ0656478.1 putative GroES-like superfamily, alcohol dehydrogenase, polyketide synthase, enoylreductase [Helianthus annuus]